MKRPPRTKGYCGRHRRNTRGQDKKKLGKLGINKEIKKKHEQTETTPTSFAVASLGTFESSKVRRVALSARSGIKDSRAPRKDQHSWKDLISSRSGYIFAARTYNASC